MYQAIEQGVGSVLHPALVPPVEHLGPLEQRLAVALARHALGADLAIDYSAEDYVEAVKAFTLLIFGLCLLGLALGDPATPMVAAALAMELIVTPLICLWQTRLSSSQELPGIAKMETHLRHMIS